MSKHPLLLDSNNTTLLSSCDILLFLWSPSSLLSTCAYTCAYTCAHTQTHTPRKQPPQLSPIQLSEPVPVPWERYHIQIKPLVKCGCLSCWFAHLSECVLS